MECHTFTWSKNYLDLNLDCELDHDPEDVPVDRVHSLFNPTQRIKLLFIVQPLLHGKPPNIWIKIIQIAIQIECIHGTKFLDPDRDPDHFAPCKCGISHIDHDDRKITD